MTQDQRNKKAEQLRLAAHIIETGCEWEAWSGISSKWFTPFNKDIEVALKGGYEIRIKEPIIPVPEGWRELRDDEKDGRWIEGAKYLCEGKWKHYEDSGCYATSDQRIIVPVAKPKKRVPLGPEDVVPGSALRYPSWIKEGSWMMIAGNGLRQMVGWINGNLLEVSYEQAMRDGLEIKRPADTEWQPCFKEVEP